jgi:hypothetical protein
VRNEVSGSAGHQHPPPPCGSGRSLLLLHPRPHQRCLTVHRHRYRGRLRLRVLPGGIVTDSDTAAVAGVIKSPLAVEGRGPPVPDRRRHAYFVRADGVPRWK